MSLENNKKRSVGFLMISTRSYLAHWFNCVKSIEQFAFQQNAEIEITIHLYSDKCIEAEQWAKLNLFRVSLVTHDIPSWGWPEVTLFRYNFFHDTAELLVEDTLIYLDVDMMILKDFSDLLMDFNWKNGLAFVPHPGYVVEGGSFPKLKLLFKPKLLLRYLVTKLLRINLMGSWEKNRKSRAYTSIRERRIYVHGAIWFGANKSLLNMVAVLQERVKLDNRDGVTAIWHDESHLNKFFSEGDYTLLSPLLSGIENHIIDSTNAPRIITVKKSATEGRDPTTYQEL